MAVSDFTLKISGVVTYDDNSKESFEASGTWMGHLGGVVATHDGTESEGSYAQLYTDNAMDVDNTLALLEEGNSSDQTTGIAPPPPAPDKTVTDFFMEMSGTVAYDDNTHGSFVVQWVNGEVDVLPDMFSAENYQAVLAVPAAKTFVTTVLEGVGGTGNVTIA